MFSKRIDVIKAIVSLINVNLKVDTEKLTNDIASAFGKCPIKIGEKATLGKESITNTVYWSKVTNSEKMSEREKMLCFVCRDLESVAVLIDDGKLTECKLSEDYAKRLQHWTIN